MLKQVQHNLWKIQNPILLVFYPKTLRNYYCFSSFVSQRKALRCYLQLSTLNFQLY